MLFSHQEILQKLNSGGKIWSPNKFGSRNVNLIVRILGFLGTHFRKIKFVNFTKSDRVTLSHTIETTNNWLFRPFNRLFFVMVEKCFKQPLFLLRGIKPKPNFPKTQLSDAKTFSKLDLTFEILSTVFIRYKTFF